MPEKEKPVETSAPKFGDIAAELALARTRAGLSHSELHRITGISRTVLIGYEAGRTRPGAKEIRSLCDALKVSPNRLIYGSDDWPVNKAAGPLPDWLDFDSDDYGTVNATVLIKMLSKEERLALLTLAHSILEARHGQQQLKEAFQAIGLMGAKMFDPETGLLSQEKLHGLGDQVEKEISQTPTRSKR